MALRAPTGPGVGRLGDAGPTECGEKTADRGGSGGKFRRKTRTPGAVSADVRGVGGVGGCVGPPARGGGWMSTGARYVLLWESIAAMGGRS